MSLYYILSGISVVLLLLYFFIDLHYFLRMCLTVLIARYFKRRAHILDSTEVTGICLTNDVDTLLYHMNNARYLREIDFARADFYERTQLYATILSKGGSVVQGATTIRYRRFIKPFTRFYIASKIIFWDDQSIYMEHRFISTSDAFIHCVALGRQRVAQCSVEEVINALITNKGNNKGLSDNKDVIENGYDATKIKPELPIEVAKWIECNSISSANLRSND